MSTAFEAGPEESGGVESSREEEEQQGLGYGRQAQGGEGARSHPADQDCMERKQEISLGPWGANKEPRNVVSLWGRRGPSPSHR